jgi:hypothetical protein
LDSNSDWKTLVPGSGAVASKSIASDPAGVTTTTARSYVINRIDGPLVPYKNAEPQAKAAYLAGLLQLRGLGANPDVWLCTVCGEKTNGDDIHISYNVPTPIPFCLKETAPGRSCAGYGPGLLPAPTR